MNSYSYWLNTPGGFYSIAYVFALIVALINSPKKRAIGPTIVFIVLFTIVETVLMTVTHGSPAYFYVPLMIVFFSLILLTVYLLFDYDFPTSIYTAIEIFIQGEFVASAYWFLQFYLMDNGYIPFGRVSIYLLATPIYILLFFIIYLMNKRNYTMNKEWRVSLRELVGQFMLGLAIYIISNISYIIPPNMEKQGILIILFTVRTLVDLGGVMILYALHVQKGQIAAESELMKLNDIMEMQRQNAEIMEKSISVINQKYHDLKYQIELLKDGMADADSLKSLEQISEDIKNYEARNKTGNGALDTILTAKSLYCQANWIEMTCVCDGHAVDFIDAVDIATLFGNLLDNAIEAVEKIDRKERRLIHLTVSKENNFTRIRVENCIGESPIIKDGLPVTTKKDKRYHGYGVKSIQATVKKYSGSVTFTSNEGWFEARILFPLG